MIYIAAYKPQHVYNYAIRQGLDKDKVRAITYPEQLRGLTGGNLYALPTIRANHECAKILDEARARFIRIINIAESCTKEELMKIDQQTLPVNTKGK